MATRCPRGHRTGVPGAIQRTVRAVVFSTTVAGIALNTRQGQTNRKST